jgi:nucleotide-binding universal stress UspA family protein
MTQHRFVPSSILVDVELPEPASLSTDLVDLLASLRIVLVGWYAVPEQTSPEQARDQFEDEAEAALAPIARAFEEAGAEVDTHLVFTPNQLDTISRISTEEDCNAVLIPGVMKHLHRVLVPLRGLHNARRIVPFVSDLVRDGTTDVTLLHVLEEGEADDVTRQDILQPVSDMMTGRGVDPEIIQLQTVESDDPADTIVEMADAYDVVVLGETKPSIQEILFGSVPETIAQTASTPIIVVRHYDERIDAAERATQAGA